MSKKNKNLLLFTIILIFISLRVAFITQKNLWFDEIFSWHLTLGSFSNIIIRTSQDIHPPLYYFTLKIWDFIFGDSVFSMRFLSAVFSILSVIFIYPLCKRVLSTANSIIVLLFFAVNPLNIFYSQEARMSAMNLFLNAGAVFFILRMLDKDQGWKQYFRQIDIYIYILFRTLALYTHYFSFFIFAVEIILVIILTRLRNSLNESGCQTSSSGTQIQVKSRRRTRMHYIISFAAIFLLYLPWLPIFIEHITRGQSWRYDQVTHSAVKELLNFIKDINLGLYYHYSNLNIVFYITVFLILLYSFAFIQYLINFIRNKDIFQKLFPFLLVIIPLLLGIIISFKQKVEFYRYLSIIVPYVLIYIVYGITKTGKKLIFIPLLVILLVVNIFGLTIQYSFDFKNDDYRHLIQHIENNFKEGDRIYVEPHYMGWSINYYKKQWDIKLSNPVNIHFGWNEIIDSINVQEPERFWLVLDYSAVDTSKYNSHIGDLNNMYKVGEKNTYYLAPTKVELYLILRKKD